MNDELSIKIKELRKNMNMTQQQLADSVGVSKSYINKIEHNQTKKPSLYILSKIANILNNDYVELTELAGYDIEDLILNQQIYTDFLCSYENIHVKEDIQFKYRENGTIDIYKVLEDYKNSKISKLDAIYFFINWLDKEEDKKYL